MPATAIRGLSLSSFDTKLVAIFTAILWATAFLPVKYSLSFAPPFMLAGIRFLGAGLILLPFAIRYIPRTWPDIIRSLKVILPVALFQTFFAYAFFFTGMSKTSATVGAIVNGSSPLMVALLTHVIVRGERMTTVKAISIALGIAGVTIVTVGRTTIGSFGSLELLGVGLLLCNAVAYGLGNILAAHNRNITNPVTLNSFQMIIGGLGLLGISAFTESAPTAMPPIGFFIALGWLMILSALTFTLWFSLLRRPGVKVSELNLWYFIVPVLGPVITWVALPTEHPRITDIVAIALVAGSLIWYSRAKTALERQPLRKEPDLLVKNSR